MKRKLIIGIVVAALVLIGGTTAIKEYGNKITPVVNKNQLEAVKNYNFSYTVNPETFEITTDYNGVKAVASKPMPKMKVTNLVKTDKETSWTYPEKHINVKLTKETNYLNVEITSTTKDENNFEFPNVQASSYLLPIGEGKYVPADNSDWKSYLNDYKNTTLEMFSMPFFALNEKDYSLLYIMTNPYNNNITFNTKDNVEFNINHNFPVVNKNKTYGFRIYVTGKDSVDVAKTYKNYVVKNGDFKTLQEKEKENPNVKKLIGAPQFYLWNNRIIEPDNINWTEFRKELTPAIKGQIVNILQKEGGEQDQIQAIESVGKTDYVEKYTRNLITSAITSACMSRDFYNANVFKNNNEEVKELLNKGINNLDQVELIKLNENLLKEAMPNAFAQINEWANSATTDVIKSLHNAGIQKAWIGLNNWTQAYMKPQMIEEGVKDGYLMAPYDSYASIQDPGNAAWDTADFKDKSLYNDATIINKDGKYITGFKGKGRTLNATLAMPSVKKRINTIKKNIPDFNSWFVDCDAAGQVFTDYSKEHPTTKREIIEARLKRLNYVGDKEQMVVGSEGGHDYASEVLDYAQGIDSQPFSWMDRNTMQNKKSEYYTGAYYSKTGGVPPKFGKTVPVQQVYKTVFMNPAYTIPLYKLVYNNSIINTYHWLWGTLKAQGEVQNNLLHNILYNVPGLYHIDASSWNKDKDIITNNTKIFEPFSNIVSYEEMTNFQALTSDRLVQMAEYGNNVKVISNFSNNEVTALGYKLKPKSLVILEGGSNPKVTYYSPENL